MWLTAGIADGHMNDRAEVLADQVTQLRQELSLAEEGLANYQQENERLNAHCAQLSKEHHDALDEVERLRALLTQAPIAKITVWNHLPPNVALYTPGLPPGEYDLYLMPDVPQSAPHAAEQDTI